LIFNECCPKGTQPVNNLSAASYLAQIAEIAGDFQGSTVMTKPCQGRAKPQAHRNRSSASRPGPSFGEPDRPALSSAESRIGTWQKTSPAVRLRTRASNRDSSSFGHRDFAGDRLAWSRRRVRSQ